MRILLAEDNITNQKVALKLLDKMGHHADAVANGKEALEALESISYDLILMDVQMPEMDGLAAARSIRSREKATGKHVPIIAMTANAMHGDRETCLAAGMDGYMAKPVEPEQLRQAIANAAGEKGATPPCPTGGKIRGEESPMPDFPPFDQADLINRLEGDEDLMDEILGIFLRDAARHVSGLQVALDEKDLEKMIFSAHTLKGSAANAGAKSLSDLSRRIEMHARAGDIGSVGALVSLLSPEFDKTTQAIAHEMEGKEQMLQGAQP